MAVKKAKATSDVAPVSAVFIELPYVPGVEMTSGMRLDVSLTRREAEIFHGIGHALVRSGTRLRDGSEITYDRSFRTHVLRYLLDEIGRADAEEPR